MELLERITASGKAAIDILSDSELVKTPSNKKGLLALFVFAAPCTGQAANTSCFVEGPRMLNLLPE